MVCPAPNTPRVSILGAILAADAGKVNGRGCPARQHPYALASALGFFALTAVLIAVAWWWLGAPGRVAVAADRHRSRKALLRLLCALPRQPRSAGGRHPRRALGRSRRISLSSPNILAAFAPTQSMMVPKACWPVPAACGLKVMHGVWVSGDPEKNQAPGRNLDRTRQGLPGRHDRHGDRQRGVVAR